MEAGVASAADRSEGIPALKPAYRFSERSQAWLQLVRPPNLLTVPGDPLAGYFLASGASVVLPAMLTGIGCVFCLYMAGLIFNDCVDYKEDMKHRPFRPIPSGRVSRQHAAIAGIGLVSVGLILAMQLNILVIIAYSLLLATLLIYTFITKHRFISGSVTMGLCRGFSLLLGISIHGHWPVNPSVFMIAMLGVTAYIASVTMIAFRETEQYFLGLIAWGPWGAAFLTSCGLMMVTSGRSPIFWVFVSGWIVYSGYWSFHLRSNPEPVSLGKGISALLKGHLLTQSTLLSLYPGIGTYASFALVLMWPVHRLLMKKFYAT